MVLLHRIFYLHCTLKDQRRRKGCLSTSRSQPLILASFSTNKNQHCFCLVSLSSISPLIFINTSAPSSHLFEQTQTVYRLDSMAGFQNPSMGFCFKGRKAETRVYELEQERKQPSRQALPAFLGHNEHASVHTRVPQFRCCCLWLKILQRFPTSLGKKKKDSPSHSPNGPASPYLLVGFFDLSTPPLCT